MKKKRLRMIKKLSIKSSRGDLGKNITTNIDNINPENISVYPENIKLKEYKENRINITKAIAHIRNEEIKEIDLMPNKKLSLKEKHEMRAVFSELLSKKY